jgi:surface protein
MFFNCNLLKSIDLTKFDTKLITDMSCFIIVPLFQILDLSYTKKVTDMNHMFYKCSRINSFDLSNFETYNITDMSEMFAECISLAYLDISNFKTYKVANMNSMFKGMMN